MTTKPANGTSGGPAGLPERKQGSPVGEHLRAAAVAAVVERGWSAAAAARHFGLGGSSVRLWVKRFRERGHVRPERMGGSASRIEPEHGNAFSASWRSARRFPLRNCAMRSPPRAWRSTPPRCSAFLKRHGLERDSRLARLRRKRRPRPG